MTPCVYFCNYLILLKAEVGTLIAIVCSHGAAGESPPANERKGKDYEIPKPEIIPRLVNLLVRLALLARLIKQLQLSLTEKQDQATNDRHNKWRSQ
jgi:hypothetical protein